MADYVNSLSMPAFLVLWVTTIIVFSLLGRYSMKFWLDFLEKRRDGKR